jgi:phage tail sheath protein FI
MPEYLAPGVYVEEIEVGAKPIEGVSTSTAGFLGETERGPTKPQLVTSFLQFQRFYGGYLSGEKYLPYAVEGFFANGGQRCYIARIVDQGATTASAKLTKNSINALTVTAVGEGAWGEKIKVEVKSGTEEDSFKLTVTYNSIEEVFDNLSVVETSADYYAKRINGISDLITISQEPASTTEVPAVAASHKLTDDAGNPMLTVTAKQPGSDGNDIKVKVEKVVVEGVEAEDRFKLTVRKGDASQPYEVMLDGVFAAVNENTEALITISQESDDSGGLPTAPTSLTKLTGGADSSTSEVAGDSGELPTGPTPATNLDGGSDDGAIDADDYTRIDTANQLGKRRGLTAFEEIDDISIVYVPNVNADASVDNKGMSNLARQLITHCELLKDRFAIIDVKFGQSKVSDIDPRSGYPTKYAAFYYPWIKVYDPLTKVNKLVPPGGHVAGIYARSDTERGVHKAPANEKVRGAVKLEFDITKGEQQTLNPRGVNCIRAFPGRGIRVWGGRTLSSNTLWKYINVRRLFLFLEESIEEGTQWVVFEPNDEKLWARVKQSITQFLTRVWKDGALMGTTPEEAFFVKCDRSTMTQDDIDNGRLIVLIGVAPVKPAEFVIFRIAQWSGGSEVSE